MTPSLRLSLLLSVAVHAALAATVRMELQARPEQTVMEAWLRPRAASAAAAATEIAPVKPVPAAREARALPTRVDRPAEAAPAAPAAAPSQAVEIPPAAPAVAHAPAAPSPVSPVAVAAAPAQAALEPPRYNAAYLSNPEPPYPISARRRGIEGTVLVEVLVSRRGEALEVKLVASAGDAALDAAALEAVHGWRFVPARRGSEPVEAAVRIPVVYRLN